MPMVGSPALWGSRNSLALAAVLVATVLPPAWWAVAVRSAAEAEPVSVVATVLTSASVRIAATLRRPEVPERTLICELPFPDGRRRLQTESSPCEVEVLLSRR